MAAQLLLLKSSYVLLKLKQKKTMRALLKEKIEQGSNYLYIRFKLFIVLFRLKQGCSYRKKYLAGIKLQ